MKKPKILVLGPMPNQNGQSVGGVAEFDVSVARALSEHFEVTVLTTSDNPVMPSRVEVIKTGWLSMLKQIKAYAPDLIISSLHYSLIAARYNQAKKIHFVHGFVTRTDYSVLKRWIWDQLNHQIQKKFDLQIGNSFFTQMINEKMLGNPVDAVVPLPVNQAFYQEYKIGPRAYDYIFAGRLVAAKGLDKVIRALALLPREQSLLVVGDGVERANYEQLARKLGVHVTFTGAMDRLHLIEYYRQAKVFISLNSAEPFGLTYIEALSQGCKVLSPVTGGQVENLLRFKDNVAFLYGDGIHEIADQMQSLLKREVSPVTTAQIKVLYSYDAFSTKLIKIFKGANLL